jgi:hypothetical protein
LVRYLAVCRSSASCSSSGDVSPRPPSPAYVRPFQRPNRDYVLIFVIYCVIFLLLNLVHTRAGEATLPRSILESICVRVRRHGERPGRAQVTSPPSSSPFALFGLLLMSTPRRTRTCAGSGAHAWWRATSYGTSFLTSLSSAKPAVKLRRPSARLPRHAPPQCLHIRSAPSHSVGRLTCGGWWVVVWIELN